MRIPTICLYNFVVVDPLFVVSPLFIVDPIVCGSSVFVPCFVMHCLVSFLACNHLDRDEEASCFTLIVLLCYFLIMLVYSLEPNLIHMLSKRHWKVSQTFWYDHKLYRLVHYMEYGEPSLSKVCSINSIRFSLIRLCVNKV